MPSSPTPGTQADGIGHITTRLRGLMCSCGDRLTTGCAVDRTSRLQRANGKLLTDYPNIFSFVPAAPTGKEPPIYTVTIDNHHWSFSSGHLSTRSEFFHRMIKSPFKESKECTLELDGHPLLAFHCMMQYLGAAMGANPPSYQVPTSIGEYHAFLNAMLNAHVFALGEKYVVHGLRDLAMARFTKATRVCPELSGLFTNVSAFSTWSENEQMCLVQTLYCGGETIDTGLRDELIIAVAHTSLESTQKTMTVRSGYPDIRHHLVTALANLENRDLSTIERLVSTCGTDKEIAAILCTDTPQDAGGGLPWQHTLREKGKMIKLALQPLDNKREFQSWVALSYLDHKETWTVNERKMVEAWIGARNTWKNYEAHHQLRLDYQRRLKEARASADDYSAKIDAVKAEINALETRPDHLRSLASQLEDATADCQETDGGRECLEHACNTLRKSSEHLEKRRTELEQSLQKTSDAYNKAKSTIVTYEKGVASRQRLADATKQQFELFSLRVSS